MNERLQLFVKASMLAAMTCIATMIIKIPIAATGGYINIGDTVVLLAAWLLGNPYGACAAALGSALADILSGYVVYAPATAIIKFVMAFVCCIVSSSMIRKKITRYAAFAVSSVIAEIIMIAGYFLYESTVMGYGLAAAAAIPGNAVQGIVSLILGNVLIHVLAGVLKPQGSIM